MSEKDRLSKIVVVPHIVIRTTKISFYKIEHEIIQFHLMAQSAKY